eukprot:TRINITY_DN6829_c0_g1_i3.p1 TRINITY_DN6829_c0_g1~~TRINITY_DN6829_c0_g1_i3.p1  ORF type:complete len:180 (-),score=30.40 TRINITY_DN6829_c0_g1_i3:120-659(-)
MSANFANLKYQMVPSFSYVGFCDAERKQFVGYDITYMEGDVGDCDTTMPVPCAFENITDSASPSTLPEMLANGIPDNAQFTGAAYNCSSPGNCETYYILDGPACSATSAAAYRQWIIVTNSDHSSVLPQGYSDVIIHEPFGRCETFVIHVTMNTVAEELPSHDDIEGYIASIPQCPKKF